MPETRMLAKLLATTAVTDLVGDRIRKHHRKTDWGQSDAITYQRISTDWVNGADKNSSTAFARIQLDLWSSTPLGARALANAVRTALNGWRDTDGSPAVSMCHFLNEQDLPQGPDSGEEATEYRISQDYLIQYSE